ncbi:BTAD domain-containing putative transcriptional regulator [Chitinimonas sp. BJB300]|uniref:BTAD domain-containing putative transcriptional regulator n=1 Tax=Chitinimonas sp. BJB300 TaxID=1559339 RepID=UPI0018ECCA5E|nr:BTAD domain-containing putative transcriptional regulator [Chitinimonas sp. BJB300]
MNTEAITQQCLEILNGRQTLADVAGLDANALEAIYSRGYAAWEAGDIDAATADFGFLVLHQPLDRRFHYAFASALHRQGELMHALTIYGYAAAMQANEPGAIYRIAECLYELGEIEATRDALDAVIALCYGQPENREFGALLQHARAFLIRIND